MVGYKDKPCDYHRMDTYFEELLSRPEANQAKSIAKLLAALVNAEVLSADGAAEIAGKPPDEQIIDSDYSDW